MVDLNAESKDEMYFLPNLKEIVSHHIAFQNITKLEKIALENKIKIIFVPKFHCELNPIEGFWCFTKQYVRKRNETIKIMKLCKN